MGESVTVLIVDDDPLVRVTFVRILQHGGFGTMGAEDGIEGLKAFRAKPPDLVLLDLRMPNMDGLDVLSAMVAERPEIPVIVTSGEGTLRDAVEALRRGAWDFVTKPMFDPELLVRSCERALEKATLRRQNQEYRSHLEHANRVLAGALAELREDQQGARALQFQLLPQDGLVLGAYTGHRRLYPSQLLSGDFVDYFSLGDRRVGFYVADVSGHGAASAFVTAILTTLVGKYREELAQKLDETALDPAALLRRLDVDLKALTPDKHVTMFYGVLDPKSASLRYANAGLFPFPLVRAGNVVTELECPGRPLGLPGAGSVAAGEIRFGADARLLAMTDGVLELGDDRPQRDKRQQLRQLFERSANLEELERGLGLDRSATLRDDVALLYLQGQEPTPTAGRGAHA
jgi:sigma-B regulation protein RsbU (phosphoserine phosphatase)